MSPGKTKQAITARNKLWHRIWCGEIAAPAVCEQCKRAPHRWDPLQAHHDDYAKPLDVRWLCRSCHTRHHVALRKAAAALTGAAA